MEPVAAVEAVKLRSRATGLVWYPLLHIALVGNRQEAQGRGERHQPRQIVRVDARRADQKSAVVPKHCQRELGNREHASGIANGLGGRPIRLAESQAHEHGAKNHRAFS